MSAFCDFCGGHIRPKQGETPVDYFCMGCERFACMRCHELRAMPTGPHRPKDHRPIVEVVRFQKESA